MKKLVLVTLFLFSLPYFVYCQYFELTPSGMKSLIEPEGADYLVLNFPDKSQSELFDAAHDYVVSSFNSAKDVMSESEPNVLSLKAAMPFKLSNGFVKYDAILNYKYNILFKEGRVRVEFHLLDFIVLPTNGNVPKFSFGLVRQNISMQGVFTKQGKIIKVGGEDTKRTIEDYANRLTQGLAEAITGVANNDW